jgi:hypothetical protein
MNYPQSKTDPFITIDHFIPSWSKMINTDLWKFLHVNKRVEFIRESERISLTGSTTVIRDDGFIDDIDVEIENGLFPEMGEIDITIESFRDIPERFRSSWLRSYPTVQTLLCFCLQYELKHQAYSFIQSWNDYRDCMTVPGITQWTYGYFPVVSTTKNTKFYASNAMTSAIYAAMRYPEVLERLVGIIIEDKGRYFDWIS